MTVACIIGSPVAHSLSPAIHNAAFDALGLDWTYTAVEVAPGALGEGMERLRAMDARGVNVTMPHKREVLAFAEAVDPSARDAGAANTLVWSGSGYIAHNTDGDGFVRFLRADASFDPGGRRVTMLGAGGAARGVALALARAGARVTVCARRPEAAAEIAALGGGIAAGDWDAPPGADLVVNATPLRDGLPGVVASLAVDMTYVHPRSGFLEAAEGAGASAFDGLGMLVHQAALSFELWTGVAAPVEVMRGAAGRARGD